MRKSLSGKIQKYLLVAAILGSITLIGSNAYTIYNSYKISMMTYQSSLELFMRDVDQELDDMATYLNAYSNTANAQEFCYLKQDDYFLRVNVNENLHNVIQLEKYISGLWMYSKINQYMISIRQNGKTTFEENEQVIDFIIDEENQELFTNYSWQEISIENQRYLIYMVQDKGRCYGAWCKVEEIMDKAKQSIQGQYTKIYLEDATNITDETNVIGNQFKNWKNKWIVIKPRKALWKNFDGLIMILLIFSGGIIGIMAVLLHNMQKYLVRPVKSIVKSIRKIGEGNLDERNETQDYVEELKEIGDNLNSMTKSIKNLKITIYEEKLKKKDAIIQFQNAQIKPHFMLNVINNIYSMASVGDIETIKKCCRYLADYMRYVFSQKELICSIEEEFIHIQEYIRLQELRFCDEVECNLNLEPQIMQARIPTMSIMTLVENVFKHGMGEQEILNMIIEGVWETSENLVCIRVMDNGPGFPEKIVASLNENNSFEENPKKIGIQNTIERFKELYGDCFYIHIWNSPQTTVELKFPLQIKKKEEKIV